MQPLRLLAVILSICGAWAVSAEPVIPAKDLTALIEQTFGAMASPASDGKDSTFPRYLRASLHNDDLEDLVVAILVDKAKGTLDARGIKPVSVDGQRSVDAAVGQHCLGLAFLHGSNRTRPFKPASVYMLYECFSGYAKVRAGAKLLSNAKVPTQNDAVLLDLESGGQMLIYWNNGEYNAKYVRRGD